MGRPSSCVVEWKVRNVAEREERMKKKAIQTIIAFVLVLTLACGLIRDPRLDPDETSISPSSTASLEFPDLFPAEAPTPVSTALTSLSETTSIGAEITNPDGKVFLKNSSPVVNLTV